MASASDATSLHTTLDALHSAVNAMRALHRVLMDQVRFVREGGAAVPRSSNLEAALNLREEMMTSLEAMHSAAQQDSGTLHPAHPSAIQKLKRVRPQSCEGGGSTTCPICQEEISTSSSKELMVLPCGHSFCAECTLQWLNIADTCPICRACVDNGTASHVHVEPDPAPRADHQQDRASESGLVSTSRTVLGLSPASPASYGDRVESSRPLGASFPEYEATNPLVRTRSQPLELNRHRSEPDPHDLSGHKPSYSGAVLMPTPANFAVRLASESTVEQPTQLRPNTAKPPVCGIRSLLRVRSAGPQSAVLRVERGQQNSQAPTVHLTQPLAARPTTSAGHPSSTCESNKANYIGPRCMVRPSTCGAHLKEALCSAKQAFRPTREDAARFQPLLRPATASSSPFHDYRAPPTLTAVLERQRQLRRHLRSCNSCEKPLPASVVRVRPTPGIAVVGRNVSVRHSLQ